MTNESFPQLKRCIITPMGTDDIPLVFAFDCVLTEKHDDSNMITQFPVETGAAISDHIKKNPFKLSLQGIVAESAMFDDSIFPNQIDRVNNAADVLDWMNEMKTSFKVSTSLKTYEYMAIETISIARDNRNGRVIDCSLTMQKIFTSSTLTVEAPKPKENRPKKTTKDGAANGTEVDKIPPSYSITAAEKGLGRMSAGNALKTLMESKK